MLRKLKRKIKKKVIGYVFAGFLAGKVESIAETHLMDLIKNIFS